MMMVMTTVWSMLMRFMLRLWFFFLIVTAVLIRLRRILFILLGDVVPQCFREICIERNPEKKHGRLGKREQLECGFKHKLI